VFFFVSGQNLRGDSEILIEIIIAKPR